MIVTHVFPEFQSQHGFLRAKVCVANDLAESKLIRVVYSAELFRVGSVQYSESLKYCTIHLQYYSCH